jgi:lipopolysaccharide assembly outer membrane protein LptD (OstA)
MLLSIFHSNLPAAKKSKTKKSYQGITIKAADKQEFEGDTYVASGNVDIAWEDYRIYADRLEFNRKTGELVARGRVTMTSNETVITGERFHFNVKKRTGQLYETFGQLSPTTRYTSAGMSQEGTGTLKFKKLDFTPCAQCVPRWKITCARGKIKKEKYIEMKHLVFKVKKIPVFYLPYLRYPINKDGRATGILMPRAGKSTTAGEYLLSGFYWAIRPNVDVTLNVDYYSKAGAGFAQELRYLTRNMKGNIQFYHFNYKDGFSPGAAGLVGSGEPVDEENPAEEAAPRKRDYFFKMTHQQDIPFFDTKTRLTVNIDRQSDPNFLKLLGSSIDTVVNGAYRSAVGLSSSFSNFKLAVSAARNDTFDVVNNRLVNRNYSPTLTLNMNQQKLGPLPGYFSLEAVYTNVDRRYTYYSPDAEGAPDIAANRLILKPSYTVNLIKEPWMQASLSLKSSHNFYDRSRDPEVTKYQQMIEEPLSYGYQTADFTLKGPVFSRVFESQRAKLKHLIEPKIMFRYAVNVDKEIIDRLLVLDNGDRPRNAYSYVGFSLGTRLLYKRKPDSENTGKKGYKSAREILSFTVRQDYYLDPAQANLYRTIDDIYPDFSDLKNTLRVRPVKNFNLDGTLYYSHYLKRFTYFVASLGYTAEKSPVTGSFKYIRRLNPYKYNAAQTGTEAGTGAEDEEEELTADSGIITDLIGGGLNIDIKGFPVRLDSRVDFDILHRKFRYGRVILSFDYQCITFTAGLKMFNISGRNEVRFDFGFSLGNLGMVRNLLGNKR